jgi:hypothetical protein
LRGRPSTRTIPVESRWDAAIWIGTIRAATRHASRATERAVVFTSCLPLVLLLAAAGTPLRLRKRSERRVDGRGSP